MRQGKVGVYIHTKVEKPLAHNFVSLSLLMMEDELFANEQLVNESDETHLLLAENPLHFIHDKVIIDILVHVVKNPICLQKGVESKLLVVCVSSTEIN